MPGSFGGRVNESGADDALCLHRIPDCLFDCCLHDYMQNTTAGVSDSNCKHDIVKFHNKRIWEQHRSPCAKTCMPYRQQLQVVGL